MCLQVYGFARTGANAHHGGEAGFPSYYDASTVFVARDGASGLHRRAAEGRNAVVDLIGIGGATEGV